MVHFERYRTPWRRRVLTAPNDVHQARNHGRPLKIFAPRKICWTLFKTIEHCLKRLGPIQKTFRPA